MTDAVGLTLNFFIAGMPCISSLQKQARIARVPGATEPSWGRFVLQGATFQTRSLLISFAPGMAVEVLRLVPVMRQTFDYVFLGLGVDTMSSLIMGELSRIAICAPLNNMNNEYTLGGSFQPMPLKRLYSLAAFDLIVQRAVDVAVYAGLQWFADVEDEGWIMGMLARVVSTAVCYPIRTIRLYSHAHDCDIDTAVTAVSNSGPKRYQNLWDGVGLTLTGELLPVIMNLFAGTKISTDL